MPLKIALVTPYGWNRPNGVREHVHHLASEFALMGHDVCILAPALQAESLPPFVRGYNMGWTIPIPINGTVANVLLNPALLSEVRRVFQQEAFDVVHIHEPLLPGLSLAALKASQAITIGTFHAYPCAEVFSVPALAYALIAPFLLPSFEHLTGRIAVSSMAYEFAARFFPGDYHIIPNGVDLDRFSPQVQPLPELMDGKQNILLVGRFDRRKGARYLLHAIPFIRAAHPDTRFVFVGEGHLKRGLQAFAQRQGWHDVIFTGYIPAEILPRYFASAHIFCAPSIGGESQGIVLLEAMASGKPIAASNIPGYATVVETGVDGVLVPPGDSQELAKAIIFLLDNIQSYQQFVIAGLHKIREYAWPRVAEQIMEYYMQLLRDRNRHMHQVREVNA